jgi:hypothetical protein
MVVLVAFIWSIDWTISNVMYVLNTGAYSRVGMTMSMRMTATGWDGTSEGNLDELVGSLVY